MSNIIEITPVLQSYEVEINGKVFDCRNCTGLGDCCGTVMIHSNKAACFKCKCQSMYDSTNRTKEGAEKTNKIINSTNCKNCDDSTFTEDFCRINMYLENNLQSDYVDCSNTMLVTGEFNTISDVEQKTNCNINGDESEQLNSYNPDPSATPSATPSGTPSGTPSVSQSGNLYGSPLVTSSGLVSQDKSSGGGLNYVLILILILVAFFLLK